MANEHKIGQHSISFNEPDTVYLCPNGAVSGPEGTELNRLQVEMAKGCERLFLLIDLSGLEGMDAEVRKESGLTMKTLPLRGIAVFGASFKAKVLAKLIVSAMNLFKSAADRAPLELFDTEQEARAWIAKRREELMGAAA
jgi:hypothetical protein